MRSPDVDQLAPLADLFADVLRRDRPASVAILGIAGGNGLEHVDPSLTSRVVGLDVNAQYLDATRRRFPDLPGLELHCVDLTGTTPSVAPVALVHAAMVFEHAGTGACLDNALSFVAPGGLLSVVRQLPSETVGAVSVTSFPSMETLAGHFVFVDPGLEGKTSHVPS
jgi:trans-aconitate methyltransferase